MTIASTGRAPPRLKQRFTAAAIFSLGMLYNLHAFATPLLETVSAVGFAAAVKPLVVLGADLNSNYGAPAWFAAERGHIDVLAALRDAGSDLRHGHDMPVDRAAAEGQTDAVLYILSELKDPRAHATALSSAARHGQAPTVAALLGRGDTQAVLDRTLIDASSSRDVATVLTVVEAGANVVADDSQALRTAATMGNLPNVALLLSLGADPASAESEALRIAASAGDARIVRALLSAGADPLARSGEALENAKAAGNQETVELLENATQSRRPTAQKTPAPSVR